MVFLIFVFYVLAGFVGMELISYVVHRFLFHGPLWQIHETHHRPTHGSFELNDLFSVFFAGVSIGLILWGLDNPLRTPAFGIGIGIAGYGVLYFILHDLYTHRRFWPFKSRNAGLKTIRRAHQRHHQTVDKPGQEPFGLFLFPYDEFGPPPPRSHEPRD